jgi:bacteriocin biosynthesis cyclodehydratase domain-containing protein
VLLVLHPLLEPLLLRGLLVAPTLLLRSGSSRCAAAPQKEKSIMSLPKAPDLPTHPYLKPWYRLSAGDGKLVFEYADNALVFDGRATERFLPSLLALLDGTRTIDEIETQLGKPAAPAIDNALRLLAEKKLLTEGPPLGEEEVRPVSETLHFLTASFEGLSVTQTRAALEQSTVTVLGSGPVAAELHRILQLSSVRVERCGWSTETDGGANLVVAAPSGAELRELGPWNRRALASSSPWLQLLPFDGRFAAVGPLFVPRETCCYECYRLRRLATSDYPTEAELLEDIPAPWPSPPALDATIAGLGGTIVMRWLVARDDLATGMLLSLEARPTLSLASHWVYRVPRCRACAAVSTTAAPLPWYKEVAA